MIGLHFHSLTDAGQYWWGGVSLQLNVFYILSPTIDAGHVCGAVREMKWTPDGRALAVAWQHGEEGVFCLIPGN